MSKSGSLLKIGDIVEAKIISEIIALRPDGHALLRNFGSPVAMSQLKKFKDEGKSTKMDDGN